MTTVWVLEDKDGNGYDWDGNASERTRNSAFNTLKFKVENDTLFADEFDAYTACLEINNGRGLDLEVVEATILNRNGKHTDIFENSSPRTSDLSKIADNLKEFAQYPNVGKNLTHTLLGLGGEVGEVLDKVKKFEMQGLDVNNLPFKERVSLVKELGDVVWYTVMALAELQFTLLQCMTLNFLKLKSRKTRGKILGSGDDR